MLWTYSVSTCGRKERREGREDERQEEERKKEGEMTRTEDLNFLCICNELALRLVVYGIFLHAY